jgi:ribosome-associated heat shock protein Hsp15
LRIDKFLNTVNIVKRRSLAEDMCKSGVVKINDKVAKPAKDVKVGDTIEITYLDKVKKFQVLKIPTTKTLPKSAKDEYVKEI